jgi:hypothetical protein
MSPSVLRNQSDSCAGPEELQLDPHPRPVRKPTAQDPLDSGLPQALGQGKMGIDVYNVRRFAQAKRIGRALPPARLSTSHGSASKLL